MKTAQNGKKATVKTVKKMKDSVNNHPKKTTANWVLRLYVAGQTEKCLTAFKNLKAICENQLEGKFEIEVIDLLINPHLCRDDQILAIPTLVRRIPVPVRKIIGDLSNTEKVLVGLDLQPKK